MLTDLIATFRHWTEERRQRAQLRTLLDKDDRLLTDIGLTRHDIEMALDEPISTPARTEAYRRSAFSLQFDGLR